MLYRTHFQSPPGAGQSFGITINDEAMTWESDPTGHDLTEPVTAYFSRGGPPGSGKQFQVLPGGRARAVKQ